jgi:hypothetical protein
MEPEKLRSRMAAAAAIAALAAIFSGCLATPYQPDGIGGGYSESRIDASTVTVSFRANSQTPKRVVESYLLYRCAQVTRNAGFDYFVPLDGEGKASALGRWIPSTGSQVDDARAVSPPYFAPGAISFTPEGAARVSIRMFRDVRTASNPAAYRAADVIDTLGATVRGESQAAADPETGPPPTNAHVYSGRVIDYLAGE